MSERLSVTGEKDADESALYNEAIEGALSGFAKDGGAWLHGRDVFKERRDQGDSLDASLREAIAVASEDAESSPEDAMNRFWRRIEGEGGPHELYSGAIGGALSGFAKDGGTWLHAHDMFFEAIREGKDAEQALRQALDIASASAESSYSQAAERFWQAVDGYEAPLPEDENEMLLSPEGWRETTQTTSWHWPEQAVEIGGATSRVEYNEAEDIFRRVEVRGDGRVGVLTPELLEQAGLLPHHRMEAEGRTVWFSQAYDLGRGRAAVVGYAQNDDGSVVARSYYRSNSQGVWRYLPQYSQGEHGGINWYSKGHGEESVTLPAAFQEGLTRSLEDDGELLALDYETTQTVFAGTARHLGSEGTVYHRLVSEYPQQLLNMPNAGFGRLPSPESLQPVYEQSPRFDRILSSWEQDTELYGRVVCEQIPSMDGTLRYIFSRDARGRAWISSIENGSPIESTGLRQQWMTGGALATPAYEYAQQSGGYGNESDRKSSYVDMFEGYLSKIPTIQAYLASVRQR